MSFCSSFQIENYKNNELPYSSLNILGIINSGKKIWFPLFLEYNDNIENMRNNCYSYREKLERMSIIFKDSKLYDYSSFAY